MARSMRTGRPPVRYGDNIYDRAGPRATQYEPYYQRDGYEIPRLAQADPKRPIADFFSKAYRKRQTPHLGYRRRRNWRAGEPRRIPYDQDEGIPIDTVTDGELTDLLNGVRFQQEQSKAARVLNKQVRHGGKFTGKLPNPFGIRQGADESDAWIMANHTNPAGYLANQHKMQQKYMPEGKFRYPPFREKTKRCFGRRWWDVAKRRVEEDKRPWGAAFHESAVKYRDTVRRQHPGTLPGQAAPFLPRKSPRYKKYARSFQNPMIKEIKSGVYTPQPAKGPGSELRWE